MLLAVNVKTEPDEAIPAQESAEDLIETCQAQVIRWLQDPDHHGASLA